MIFEWDRWAHSSADKTLAECIACIHFNSEDRAAVAAANAKQIVQAAFIVSACNSHHAMKEALTLVRMSLGWQYLSPESKNIVDAALALSDTKGI